MCFLQLPLGLWMQEGALTNLYFWERFHIANPSLGPVKPDTEG